MYFDGNLEIARGIYVDFVNLRGRGATAVILPKLDFDKIFYSMKSIAKHNDVDYNNFTIDIKC